MTKRVKFNDDHDYSAMPGTDPAFIQGFIDGKHEGRGLNEEKPTRNRTPHYDSGFILGHNVGANDKMLREQKIKDAIEAADRGDPVNRYNHSQVELTEEEYRQGQKRLLETEKEDLLESYGGKKRRKSKRRKSSKSKKSRRRRQKK
jgi:hypothetical protein